MHPGAGFSSRFLQPLAPLMGLLVVALACLLLIFGQGLRHMVGAWGSEEYSHGYLIPLVAAYLMWIRRAPLMDALAAQPPGSFGYRGAGWGLAALALSLGLLGLGELSAVYTLIEYAFILGLWALALLCVGRPGVPVLAMGLVYLLFMVPLPSFLYNNLSSSLQLLSSDIGVVLLRLMGVSVYLEGNIIDLGNYQLEVAEACSGLRYLFPLLSFTVLVAFLYRRPWWIRGLLVLAAAPITLIMNSVRIAVIGISVDIWGIHMAEGVLHAFEGWVVFIACLAILAGIIWLIERLAYRNRDLLSVLFSDTPDIGAAIPIDDVLGIRTLRPLMLAVGLLLLVAMSSLYWQRPVEIEPPRSPFTTFPLLHQGWLGREGRIAPEIVKSLKLSDYLMADYARADDPVTVNLYVAYYASQRKGASVHSPRSCIPADGWIIEQLEQIDLDQALGRSPVAGRPPARVSRVVIRKGEYRQLVYYWLQQRGRRLTNEYLAKWYIFQDSLLRSRTDGALVRLVTPLAPGETDAAAADARLLRFAADFEPLWPAYLPE